MSLTERSAVEADPRAERDAKAERANGGDSPDGVASYEVVTPMDATGRMRVRFDGVEFTVVGSGDPRIARRLADRAAGATVRMELSPAPSGHGYVAARVKPGGLPAL